MEDVSYVVQIITNIFLIVGTFFAVFQYKKQKKLAKIDNAIGLSKYFATKMINKIEFLYSVFLSKPDIMDIIKKHTEEIENASDFTKVECDSIFTEDEKQKYSDFIKTVIPLGNAKKITVERLMNDVMNEFEHCSMSFNTGIAEDTAVYQSMHQVIFNIFPCFYPYICSINGEPIDKYYTHLCELYARWNRIKQKAIKKQTKANKKVEKCKRKNKNVGQIKRPKV